MPQTTFKTLLLSMFPLNCQDLKNCQIHHFHGIRGFSAVLHNVLLLCTIKTFSDEFSLLLPRNNKVLTMNKLTFRDILHDKSTVVAGIVT